MKWPPDIEHAYVAFPIANIDKVWLHPEESRIQQTDIASPERFYLKKSK